MRRSQVPPQYTYGNFRRNIITGPGIAVMNAGLGKIFDAMAGSRCEVREFARTHSTCSTMRASATQGTTRSDTGQSAQITGVTIGGRAVQLYGKISF